MAQVELNWVSFRNPRQYLSEVQHIQTQNLNSSPCKPALLQPLLPSTPLSLLIHFQPLIHCHDLGLDSHCFLPGLLHQSLCLQACLLRAHRHSLPTPPPAHTHSCQNLSQLHSADLLLGNLPRYQISGPFYLLNLTWHLPPLTSTFSYL